jgi:cholesterol transport system auxiliary component
MRARWIILVATIALTGGGAPPTVPDFTYFRLPPPQALAVSAAPLFHQAVVVDAFDADGLYADQALIYAEQADAQQLRQYHYQLWTDPPTRILQRRLITELRQAHVAATVTDELPASDAAIRISGIILRFDRVPVAGGGFSAVVALKLRADGPRGAPLIDDYYRADKAAAGANLKATVDAYGAAVDEIFAQFYADLRRQGTNVHAR